MRHELIIDGVSSLTYGIYVDGHGTFQRAEPDVEMIEIPGRNGDLTLSHNRWRNVQVSYDLFTLDNFEERYNRWLAFLLSKPGYRKIIDTHHPEYFRKGRIYGNPNVSEVAWKKDAGSFYIQFDCMPQRFMVEGDIPVEVIDGETATLVPPDGCEYYEAKPLITVDAIIGASGRIVIGNTSIDVSDTSDYPFDIDCDLESAGWANEYISLPDGEFPKLDRSSNSVYVQNIFVHIKPRWFFI